MNRLVLTALAAMLASTMPAKAALTLCNRTGSILYAATAAVDGNTAATQGWLRLAPGDCQPARKEALTAGSYLVHAHTALAYPGPSRAWGGNVSLCVTDADFAIRETSGSRICAEGLSARPFARLDTHGKHDWTMSFDEAPALASLTAAQLIGVKRLLAINGFHVGAMDDKPNPLTGAALALFRKRMHFAPDAGNSQLFAALETEALKTTTPPTKGVAGYSARIGSKGAMPQTKRQTGMSK